MRIRTSVQDWIELDWIVLQQQVLISLARPVDIRPENLGLHRVSELATVRVVFRHTCDRSSIIIL